MCFGVCVVERASGLGCWAYCFEGCFALVELAGMLKYFVFVLFLFWVPL